MKSWRKGDNLSWFILHIPRIIIFYRNNLTIILLNVPCSSVSKKFRSVVFNINDDPWAKAWCEVSSTHILDNNKIWGRLQNIVILVYRSTPNAIWVNKISRMPFMFKQIRNNQACTLQATMICFDFGVSISKTV